MPYPQTIKKPTMIASAHLGLECCYCWQTTTFDRYDSRRFDLHEIILSRGAIRGTDDNTMISIMSIYNCGWVHQDTCHKMAEGGDGRLRGIMYLIRYEGFTPILAWLNSMSLVMDVRQEIWDLIRVREEVETLMKGTRWQ